MRTIALLLLAFLLAPGAAPAQTVVFTNARVFTGDRVLERTDVLVRDGRIAACRTPS
ncbi:MAG TPA: hypothetical protein VFZ69_05800 [Longimicrobiales bacterium]